MTEYNCSCHIDGVTYKLLTCGAITTQQAIQQLEDCVTDEGGDFARVDGLIIDLIDIE